MTSISIRMAMPTRFPSRGRAAAFWRWTATAMGRSMTAVSCSARKAATGSRISRHSTPTATSRIDENDAVGDKLRIWMKDEAGHDRLVALGRAGVGAIYLGNVLSTEFAVKDTANTQQGRCATQQRIPAENGMASA